MGKKNGILIAEGINKKFGGVHAVRNLNLVIQYRKITGLIGPNGAGKTTFFNLINGVFPVDAGEIKFMETRINGLKTNQIAQMGIARTFQTLNNFPRLSVFENVRAGIISKFLDEKTEEEKIRNMLEVIGIYHLSQKNVTEITPASRRLVEVGRALIAEPKLVLFDEIMAGFNEEETVKLIDIIRNYSKQGITFCVIGHTMRAIMDISDIVIVMHEGTKFAEGTPGEIQKNLDVERIYLGE